MNCQMKMEDSCCLKPPNVNVLVFKVYSLMFVSFTLQFKANPSKNYFNVSRPKSSEVPREVAWSVKKYLLQLHIDLYIMMLILSVTCT